MPRYSYRCDSCGGVFETQHSMSEDLEAEKDKIKREEYK